MTRIPKRLLWFSQQHWHFSSPPARRKKKSPNPKSPYRLRPWNRPRSSTPVSAEAILFPLEQAAITPKISAPVKKFLVKRGSRVHAGELLAVLENEDLAAAATDNHGALEQAQATYQTTTGAGLPGLREIQRRHGSRPENARRRRKALQKPPGTLRSRRAASQGSRPGYRLRHASPQPGRTGEAPLRFPNRLRQRPRQKSRRGPTRIRQKANTPAPKPC